MKTVLVIFGAAVVVLAGAGVMEFKPCLSPENTESTCKIHELRISPCPEAAEGKPCRVETGTDASIEFDYTTNFQADELETQAYWLGLTFSGLNTNGCASTTCPLEAYTKQTYNMTLPISIWYIAGKYEVKWKLWNPKREEQGCCFMLEMELH